MCNFTAWVHIETTCIKTTSFHLLAFLVVVKKRELELGEKGKKMRTPRAREEEGAERAAVSLTWYALARNRRLARENYSSRKEVSRHSSAVDVKGWNIPESLPGP